MDSLGPDLGGLARLRANLSSLAFDARKRSRLPRLAIQALVAAASAAWIGPWALAWLAAVQLTERVVEPLFVERVRRSLGTHPVKAAVRLRS